MPSEAITVLLPTMIKAENIYKTYGDLDVLKGIDLEINQGEFVAIVGASGAGKSTLLHILGTLDIADKGKLSLAGDDISQMKPKQIAQFRNRKIGFVFQFHNLLPEFTALENVCLPALLAGESQSQAEKRAKELLESLGIAARAKHLPAEMSGGEQQRTAVARALINQPLVVFADEPSGNLDSQNSQDLHQLFLKLRDDFGQTFVIVTHSKELADLSDRRLTIQDGVILD